MTTIEQINTQIDELMRRRRVMEAAKEGKRIEARNTFQTIGTDWVYCKAPLWHWNNYDYRIVPEPKVVPWTRADVPFIAMYRVRGVENSPERFPLSKAINGLRFYDCFMHYEALAEGWEHTTDGTNWKPCYKHEN